jgi:SAM-dependent methyltransferase
MNPRTSTNPWVRRATERLAAINARHPWSHNDHFHGWVVRRLPARTRRVLDVGCGTGTLLGALRERSRAGEVHGIDIDATMARRAAERFAGDPRVTVRCLAFDDVASPADVVARTGRGRDDVPGHDGTGERYDAVTMVASLHHLDLGPALGHARELLAPGGRLLVVGLARPASRADVAIDVVSALLNPVVGLLRHPRPLRTPTPPHDPSMPVRDPDVTFAEVARTARDLLPGARCRRRLFFRYTLEWTHPR